MSQAHGWRMEMAFNFFKPGVQRAAGFLDLRFMNELQAARMLLGEPDDKRETIARNLKVRRQRSFKLLTKYFTDRAPHIILQFCNQFVILFYEFL